MKRRYGLEAWMRRQWLREWALAIVVGVLADVVVLWLGLGLWVIS